MYTWPVVMQRIAYTPRVRSMPVLLYKDVRLLRIFHPQVGGKERLGFMLLLSQSNRRIRGVLRLAIIASCATATWVLLLSLADALDKGAQVGYVKHA
jgi:hypothetical protein